MRSHPPIGFLREDRQKHQLTEHLVGPLSPLPLVQQLVFNGLELLLAQRLAVEQEVLVRDLAHLLVLVHGAVLQRLVLIDDRLERILLLRVAEQIGTQHRYDRTGIVQLNDLFAFLAKFFVLDQQNRYLMMESSIRRTVLVFEVRRTFFGQKG